MSKYSRNALIKSIIIAIVFFALLEVLVAAYFSYDEQSRLNNLYPKADAIESKVDNVFDSTLTISDGYLSFLTANIDSTKEETETFLDYLFSYEENYVRNIAVIEDTTIIYNYPFEGNESSIGVDLAQIETQKDDILRVKNNLDSIFLGPVELVQGGKAFILRIPITQDGVYWGQIATVIDADLFEQLLIEEANNNNLTIDIRDSNTEKQILKYGAVSNQNQVVESTYNNKYFSWDITVTDTTLDQSLFFRIMSRFIGIIIIITISYIYYKDNLLDSQIVFNSKHDSLTGDYNRTKFMNDYNQGKLNGRLIAFTDVNKFKLLNDTLGHSFGDWCLKQVSNKFKSLEIFRVYRISGDEFILVSKVPMTIKEFRNELPSNHFTFYNEEFKQNVDIDVSIGVLEELIETIDLETILMYLDYAMYDAKKENKGVTIVNQELMAVYDNTKVIEQQLIDDIKKNNLIPYYQPIINLDTQKIEGFEVLSRWIYQGEIRSAGMFIDTVKKIKYVDLVDKNLFNKLQLEHQELINELEEVKDFSFAINLSAETLQIFEKNKERFDVFVKNRSIAIDKITFEISEDMNLGLISIETLRYMQEKGYSITVDDFGAGVSKLSDVLSGELKTIKTDKSLLPIHEEHDKKTNAFYTLIKAIKASGTKICVEGVETPLQLELSKNAGCTLGQGYLFSKPMPKEDVIPFIRNFKFSDYIPK